MLWRLFAADMLVALFLYIYIFNAFLSFPFLISFLVQGFLPEALIIPFDGFHYYRKELLAMPDPDEKMYWRGVRACVCVLSLVGVYITSGGILDAHV